MDNERGWIIRLGELLRQPGRLLGIAALPEIGIKMGYRHAGADALIAHLSALIAEML